MSRYRFGLLGGCFCSFFPTIEGIFEGLRLRDDERRVAYHRLPAAFDKVSKEMWASIIVVCKTKVHQVSMMLHNGCSP